MANDKFLFVVSGAAGTGKEGGLFLCSGIIDDRAEEVADHLRRDGWEILETHTSEGWFSFLCR